MLLVRFPATSSLLTLALASGLLLGQASPIHAQNLESPSLTLAQDPGAGSIDESTDGLTDGLTDDLTNEPTDYRPLTQDSSVLSVQGGIRMMREATTAISNKDYNAALQKLQDARRIFNQLTNFYQDLSATFVGIDTTISESLRLKAVDTAQTRDQASYQLALVHRALNQSELAVPLLVQVIRSQNPASDLGQQCYQQLFELGFVDTPFNWKGAINTPPAQPR
jgi:hypothetical protein